VHFIVIESITLLEVECAIRGEIKEREATRCLNGVNNYLSRFYSEIRNLKDTDFCTY